MVIIKNDEYAHSLKPEFIKKVVQLGWVRTRSGYEYERARIRKHRQLLYHEKRSANG